jgi:hypothetical protein
MSQLGKDTAGTEQVATADGVGMAISDPTAIRALVNPEAKLGEVASPLKVKSRLPSLISGSKGLSALRQRSVGKLLRLLMASLIYQLISS